MTKFRTLIKRHFQTNFIVYFILSMFFIIGIIIGALIINRLNIEDSFKLIKYFNWIFNYLKDGNYKALEVFKLSLLSNFKVLLIIWILGFISLGILIISLIICWKGISIGFTVGILVKEFGFRGFLFALTGLLPHYLIIIPGFLAIGSIALSQATHRYRNKSRRFYTSEIIDYSILILLFSLIIIFGSIVEGFLTTHLLNLIELNL